jgi:CAAX protease family protein
MHDLNAPPPLDPESPEPRVDQPPPLVKEPFPFSIFLGPDGLRAGWRLLIYYALYRGLIYVGSIVLGLISTSGSSRLWLYMAGEFSALVAAVLPALLMARLERRSAGCYGLPAREAFRKLFWVGAFWGFVSISALLLALHEIPVQGAHAFDFGHLAIHGARVLKFAAFWGLFFLLVGFFEEFFFRGYTLFTLFAGLDFLDRIHPSNPQNADNSDTRSFWTAAFLLSAYFGSVHLSNPGENVKGVLAVVLIGIFFCLTLRRTGSLWFAVGFHTAFDWGETYFYSVPDSGTTAPGHLLSSSFHGPNWLTGGTVGPEGSLLAFVLIGVLWILFDRLYPEVRYRICRTEPAPALVRTNL